MAHHQRHHQPPVRQHGDTLLDQPPQPVYYQLPQPVYEERRPSPLGAFFGGLLAGLLMFAVKLMLIVAFFVALAVGCTAAVNHGLDNLPDHTSTTTSTLP